MFGKRKKVTNTCRKYPRVIFRCALDEQRTIEFISESIQNISWLSAESFIKNYERSFESIIYPEDQKIVREAIEKSVSGKQPYGVEYRFNM